MNFPKRTIKRTTNRGEEIEQSRLIKWTHKKQVRDVAPVLAFLHHSPNGGQRDAFTGAQMKALGVKRGFPDLILPYRMGDYSGLVIEMKSETGSLSTEQKDWKAHFLGEGWHFVLCRSALEALNELCLYLGLDQNSLPPLE